MKKYQFWMLWVIPSEWSQLFQVQTKKTKQLSHEYANAPEWWPNVTCTSDSPCRHHYHVQSGRSHSHGNSAPLSISAGNYSMKSIQSCCLSRHQSSKNKARSMKNWCFYYSKVCDKAQIVLYVRNIFRSCVQQNGGIKSTTISSFCVPLLSSCSCNSLWICKAVMAAQIRCPP